MPATDQREPSEEESDSPTDRKGSAYEGDDDAGYAGDHKKRVECVCHSKFADTIPGASH
jgi:hypothetical protein